MLLLGGMALLGTGVGVVVGEIPGRWVIGPLLVVAGLVLKLIGLAASEDPDGAAARPGDRRATTLGGDVVERPRLGIPAGRAPLRSARARHAARPAPHASPHREAS